MILKDHCDYFIRKRLTRAEVGKLARRNNTTEKWWRLGCGR